MRRLPKLGDERVKELERAWRSKQEDWARKRLMVMRLVAGHEHSAQEIAEMAGVSRVSVFRYVERLMEGGIEGLLARNYRGGKRATLSSTLQQQLVEKLQAGEFIRAKEAQAWVKKETGRKLALNTMYYWLGKVGGVLKVPRKTHQKKRRGSRGSLPKGSS